MSTKPKEIMTEIIMMMVMMIIFVIQKYTLTYVCM